MRTILILLIVSISSTCGSILCAQTPISTWEFYCKYLANAEKIEPSSFGQYEEHPSYDYKETILITKTGYLSDLKNFLLANLQINYKYSSSKQYGAEFLGAIGYSYAFPYYENGKIIWPGLMYSYNYCDKGESDFSNKMSAITKRTSENHWEILCNNFKLNKQNGNVYTFNCDTEKVNISEVSLSAPYNSVSNDEIKLPIGMNYYVLTIPSSALRTTDEFGAWGWNSDKTRIYLNASKNLWTKDTASQLVINRHGTDFELQLYSSYSFDAPVDRTEDGRRIYNINFCFGDDTIPLKFIGEANTTSREYLATYGSYNRFTSTLNTNAVSILDQMKRHKYCMIKIGSGNSIKTIVFNLEGLSSILDYLQ